MGLPGDKQAEEICREAMKRRKKLRYSEGLKVVNAGFLALDEESEERAAR